MRASTLFVPEAKKSYERRAMAALYAVGRLLSQPGDPTRALSPVLKVLSSFMDLHGGAVALLVHPDDPLADDAVNPYVIGATTDVDVPFAAGQGAIPPRVAHTVFKTGMALVAGNAAVELGPEAVPPELADCGTVALLAVPIRAHGAAPLVEGVLCAYRVVNDAEPHKLGPDLHLLIMVAASLGQALQFHRLTSRSLAAPAPPPTAAEAADQRAAEDLVREIIGDSPPIRTVLERIRKVAPTRATVLLRGESGTGKELFANAIHHLSPRRHKPFVKVNCAALSETLLESELFGHEKGAFTGALERKKGRFELADGGTLFLDEIGDISPAFQAKLLRALQEREFERVGGGKTIRVDVRLIAATNRDLEEAVAKGQFRADLYFRICVVPIALPPLRERREDIPRLAEVFLQRFNGDNGARLRFGRCALDTLKGCFFPGNVRELENCVQRLAALAPGPVIRAEDIACQQDACLSAQLWRVESPAGQPAALAPSGPGLAEPPPAPAPTAPSPVPRANGRAERDALIEAMERSGWVQAKAARLLNLTPRQIAYALKKHGIDVVRF
ncbi:MAG: nif-specific transcriptional activator NifA [Geminicoccaceae bacterium]|nr:MAG: nif-specific transcriptional activator NifA [Geminicoccaceae bacterium]